MTMVQGSAGWTTHNLGPKVGSVQPDAFYKPICRGGTASQGQRPRTYHGVGIVSLYTGENWHADCKHCSLHLQLVPLDSAFIRVRSRDMYLTPFGKASNLGTLPVGTAERELYKSG